MLSEVVGTAILILLGCGVVANVALGKTKGYGAGFLMVTIGWGLGVYAGVVAAYNSGAHLNPAVTIAMATIGKFPWALVPAYITAQMIGGILGGVIVWLAYLPHWAATHDQDGKLAVFCGVSEFPVRVKCASLPWHTLHAALEGKDESVSTES